MKSLLFAVALAGLSEAALRFACVRNTGLIFIVVIRKNKNRILPKIILRATTPIRRPKHESLTLEIVVNFEYPTTRSCC